MKYFIFPALFCVLTFGVSAQNTATYDIEFISNWEQHGPLPINAHFSNLIGATHNENISFFEMGKPVTIGVELVAELGITNNFKFEVNSAIDTGKANQYIEGSDLYFTSPERSIYINDLSVNESHPLLSLITMIAPSPDWIAAANNIPLKDENGHWLSNITLDLYPYDAGTEEGTAYSLSNPATFPKELITSLQGVAPFNEKRIATLKITRTNIPAPTCTDGIQNGFETDIDCGGVCNPCSKVDGGYIQTSNGLTDIKVVTNDGTIDNIKFENNSTLQSNFSYLITDESGTIISYTDFSYNFEGSSIGINKVYGISYTGNLTSIGKKITDDNLASDEFELSSNFIKVTKLHELFEDELITDGGTILTLNNETELTLYTDDGFADNISFKSINNSNTDYSYLITDKDGHIQNAVTNSIDFEGSLAGVCFVYGIAHEGGLNIEGKHITDDNLASIKFDLSNNSIKVIKKVADVVEIPEEPKQYCTSTALSSRDEYINRVQIGTIDNLSTNERNGYIDYSDISTNLTIGKINTITLTPGWRDLQYNEAYAVWIDFNKDKDFDDLGEMVWFHAPTNDQIVNGEFKIPSYVVPGETRMRITLKYSVIPGSCDIFDFGEVEDYTVHILEAEETQEIIHQLFFVTHNPLQDKLLELDFYTNQTGKAIIEIYNSSGNKVSRDNLNLLNQQTASLQLYHDLTPGLYFLSVTLNDKRQTTTIIIN